MGTVYDSELHQFIEGYFKIKGASIMEKHADFFIVAYSDGTKDAFTYSARVSAENKEIKLLAKGSKALKAILHECSSTAAFSEVKMQYTLKSIEKFLQPKECCELCPFISLCDDKSQCCNFCSFYKSCNTRIENAKLAAMGDPFQQEQIEAFCFIFTVELSNDYSLGQKVERDMAVLLHRATGQFLGHILLKSLLDVDIFTVEEASGLSSEEYYHFLNIAEQQASSILKNHLEVFKAEISSPLKEKVTSILVKYEDEYAENYTKSSMEQLEQLQEEALKLSKREIDGYSMHIEYHLKNLVLVHTTRDALNLVFEQEGPGKTFEVPAQVLLGRTDIQCTHCTTEIDTGVLCDKGHVLCSHCMERCASCKKVICNVCDHEYYICSTCGEAICPDCVTKCASCGAVTCSSHTYFCASCGRPLCLDCYENCSACDADICHEHANSCSHCAQPVCSTHTLRCKVCGTDHCPDHAKSCTLCNTVLCSDHMAHCSRCGKAYCPEHLLHCTACGDDYCNCTQTSACSICGQDYCASCIDAKGVCSICNHLKRVDSEDALVKRLIKLSSQAGAYKKYYVSISREIDILYATNAFQAYLAVFSKSGEMLYSRKIGFLEKLKLSRAIALNR